MPAGWLLLNVQQVFKNNNKDTMKTSMPLMYTIITHYRKYIRDKMWDLLKVENEHSKMKLNDIVMVPLL